MAYNVNAICLRKAKEHEISGCVFSLHPGDQGVFTKARTDLTRTQGLQLFFFFTKEEPTVCENEARYLCCKGNWRQILTMHSLSSNDTK